MPEPIDVIDDFATPADAVPTQLQKDAAEVPKICRTMFQQIEHGVKVIGDKARRSGMAAILAEYPQPQRAKIRQAIAALRLCLQAGAKNHDPGEPQDEPDPIPELDTSEIT